MMRELRIAMALVVAVGCSVSAADWPQWRGPNGTGVTDERDLPLRWSATENVTWRIDLGGVGVSTPIVSSDRVFVTSQIGTGVSRQGPRLSQGPGAATSGERGLGTARSAPPADGTFFLVEAFQRTDGRRLWRYRV